MGKGKRTVLSAAAVFRVFGFADFSLNRGGSRRQWRPSGVFPNGSRCKGTCLGEYSLKSIWIGMFFDLHRMYPNVLYSYRGLC